MFMCLNIVGYDYKLQGSGSMIFRLSLSVIHITPKWIRTIYTLKWAIFNFFLWFESKNSKIWEILSRSRQIQICFQNLHRIIAVTTIIQCNDTIKEYEIDWLVGNRTRLQSVFTSRCARRQITATTTAVSPRV